MNFDEVSKKFVHLKGRYESGSISAQEYERSARELVAMTPDGKQWYLDPHMGTWVELGTGEPRAVPPQAGAKAPETLLQFLLQMGKGLMKSIPRIILIALVMSLFTWVAHTYIIAKVNDGLMYNSARVALNSVVHLQQTHFPGINAFWGLLAYFLTSFFMRSLSLGPQQWVNQIKKTPINIKQSFEQNSERAPGALLLGAFIALLLSSAFRNFMLSWIMSIGLLLVMTAHFRGLEITVLKLGISDLQRFFGRRFIPEAEEYHRIYLALLGMVGGFILAGLWRTNFFITFVFSLLFLAAYILLHVKGTQSATALLLLAGMATLFPESPVYAWCEGASFSQAGGSWITWWGSNNADVVRTLGIMPALSSFLGGFMGSMVAITTPMAAATAPLTAAVNTALCQGSADLEPGLSTRQPDGNRNRTDDRESTTAPGEPLLDPITPAEDTNDSEAPPDPYGEPEDYGDIPPEPTVFETLGEETPEPDPKEPDRDDTPVLDEIETESEDPLNYPDELDWAEQPQDKQEPMTEEQLQGEPEAEVYPEGGIEPEMDGEPQPADQPDPNLIGEGDGVTPPASDTELPEDIPPIAEEAAGEDVEQVDGENSPEDESVSDSQTNMGELPPELTTAQLEELKNRMTQVIREKIDENYIVYNASTFEKIKWNFFYIGQGIAWLAGWNGGQCGEFAEWGIEWTREMVRDVVGEGAILHDIVLERTSRINHAGTQVIMPNGERFIFDYWEGIPSGEARIYPEKEWLEKWRKELGGSPYITNENPYQEGLKDFIKIAGEEEKGLQLYQNSRSGGRHPSGTGQTILNSYRRDPW